MKYPPQRITIEYFDARFNKRVLREFLDEHAARRFYVLKDKTGKQPKVVPNHR